MENADIDAMIVGLAAVVRAYTRDAARTKQQQPKSAVGDAILFDQRLLHRGAFRYGRESMGSPRVVVQLSFGARNAFTAAWAAGDRARRHEQLARFEAEARKRDSRPKKRMKPRGRKREVE